MINNVPGNYPQVVTFDIRLVKPMRARGWAWCPDGGETTWVRVKGDPRNHYIARMDWADNSKELLLQRLNRLQNRNAVIADAATGKAHGLRTAMRRGSSAFWLHGLGRGSVHLRANAGWQQLYLVSRAGRRK